MASTLSRNAVPGTGLLGAAILATGELLQEFGVNLADSQIDAVQNWVAVVFLLVTAILARKTATPLVDPRDADGNALVSVPPASTGKPR